MLESSYGNTCPFFDNFVPEVVLPYRKQHFTGLDFEGLRFQDSRHMKVVRSVYAPAAYNPPPQEIFVILISVRGWQDSRAIVPRRDSNPCSVYQLHHLVPQYCYNRITEFKKQIRTYFFKTNLKLGRFTLLISCFFFNISRPGSRRVPPAVQFSKSAFCHTVYLCFIWLSQWLPIIFPKLH